MSENGGSETFQHPKNYEEWKAKVESAPTPNDIQAQKIKESNFRRAQEGSPRVQDSMQKTGESRWNRFKSFFSKKEDHQSMQDIQDMNAKTDAYWKDIKDRKQSSLHASEGQSALVHPAEGEYNKIKESGYQTQEAKPAYMNVPPENNNVDLGQGGANTESIPKVEEDPYKDVIKPGIDDEIAEVTNIIANKAESRPEEDPQYKKAVDIASREQAKVEQDQRYQNLVDLVSKEQAKLEKQEESS